MSLQSDFEHIRAAVEALGFKAASVTLWDGAYIAEVVVPVKIESLERADEDLASALRVKDRFGATEAAASINGPRYYAKGARPRGRPRKVMA